jgi:hypothetical protein
VRQTTISNKEEFKYPQTQVIYIIYFIVAAVRQHVSTKFGNIQIIDIKLIKLLYTIVLDCIKN